VKSIEHLTKALHEFGPEFSLVTAGRKGAYLYDGAKMMHHDIYGVKPINTTGAGDAFGAGWLAGYLASGWNLNVAMQWGMLNSNSVIMHVGAQKGILSLSTLPKFRAIYDPS
jgi:sugar/nucleoside kinase (ribokinase family)